MINHVIFEDIQFDIMTHNLYVESLKKVSDQNISPNPPMQTLTHNQTKVLGEI